jgi:hypothetical protein
MHAYFPLFQFNNKEMLFDDFLKLKITMILILTYLISIICFVFVSYCSQNKQGLFP